MSQVSTGIWVAGSGVRGDIDYLRIISSVAVVWFHSGGPGKQFAYAGLLMFPVISAILTAEKEVHADWEWIGVRCRRLLTPWIVWSILYLGLGMISGKGGAQFGIGIILGGAAVHLWYAPFASLALVLSAVAARCVGLRWRAVAGFGWALALLLTARIWRTDSLSWPYPMPQYAHAAASLGFGWLAVGWQFWKVGVATLFVLLLGASFGNLEVTGVGLPYAEVSILGAALASGYFRALAIAPGVRELAKNSMGVYYLHPIVLAGLSRLGMVPSIWMAVATVLLSNVMVILAVRWAPLRVRSLFQ